MMSFARQFFNHARALLVLGLLVSTLHSNVASSATASDFVDPMKHDILLVTEKSYDNLINKHRNHDGVAALLHFDSSKPAQKQFIQDVYNEVAKDSRGMAVIGAIDCKQWKAFCAGNQNPEVKTPLVVVLPPNPQPPKVLEVGTPTDKQAILLAVLQHVSANNVEKIHSENIDTFLGSHLAVPKVLLVTNKPSTPVLFKALSNSFKDRLSFGVVPSNDTAVSTRFNVKKFPSVLLLKAAQKGEGLGKPLFYTGNKFTFDALHEWLNVHAETFVKGGGFSHEGGTLPEPKPWLVESIPEVTGASHQDICFRKENLCVILLTKGKITGEQKTMLEGLKTAFSEQKASHGISFRFMWLDADVEINFMKMLNLESPKFPSAVIFNPHRRLRFVTLPSGEEATQEKLTALLERVVFGDSKFTVVKGGKLPLFIPRETPEEAKKKAEDEAKKREEL